MISLRKSEERGRSTHGGWLQSAHSFSFRDYFDLKHQGHGNLLVINDDTVTPGAGFGTHSHRDMEIISYVLDGELAHRDSMGNGEDGAANSGIVRPGDVQRMSAGFGVKHSEFNNLLDRNTRFLQIWIKPKFKGIQPSYEQKHFDPEQRQGRLVLVASRTGENGSVSMNADAAIFAGLLDDGEAAAQALDTNRLTYVHLARGSLMVNGHRLKEGDGALLEDETELQLKNGRNAEVLVLDLAKA
jgi:redox-sensitive bicupin YhaK (pirin superfamily)